MIDIKELRVGNLVNLYFDGTFVRAKPITSRDIASIEAGKKSAHSYEPIPLTTDLLESAGFEKWQDDIEPYYVLETSNGLYINCNASEVWLGCEANCVSIGERLTMYVHQLQNLYFALTNEELEVNVTPNRLPSHP